MAKKINGYDEFDIPEDLLSRIQESPLFKVNSALSEYGMMNHNIVSRLESIDSLEKEEAEIEYKKFLEEIGKLFEGKENDEEVDEIYL